jgi:hypothetical protein
MGGRGTPEQRSRWNATYAARHPERVRAQSAAYRVENRDKCRERSLRSKSRNAPSYRAVQKRRADARTAYLQAIKLARGCLDCGYRDDPARLHFDHRPGSVKYMNVGQMINHARARIDSEIEKCDVRCVVCHARRHAREVA